MRENWIAFVAGACTMLVVLLLMFFGRCLSITDPPELDHITTEYLVAHASTGDILSISYNCKLSIRVQVVKAFTKSKWMHTALVYVKPETGEKCVLEAYHDYKTDAKGTQCVPLQKWIDRHIKKNYIIGWSQLTSPHLITQSFPEHFMNKPLDMNLLSFFVQHMTQQNADYDAQQDPNDKFYCTQFTVKLLQEFGLVDPNHNPRLYLPNEILYAQQLPLLNHVSYNLPKVCIN